MGCIDIGYEGDERNYHYTTTAFRNYRCKECGCLIPAEQTHEFWASWTEGEFDGGARLCTICSDVAENLTESWWLGQLWDLLEEQICEYDLPLGALDDLKNDKARQKVIDLVDRLIADPDCAEAGA